MNRDVVMQYLTVHVYVQYSGNYRNVTTVEDAYANYAYWRGIYLHTMQSTI